MSRWNAYLNNSIQIIEEYEGLIPLSAWLKNFFRLNKKMGSKDRKIIAETVYHFYRLGHSSKEVSVDEKILAAVFLCNPVFNNLLEFFRPEWNAAIDLPLSEKLKMLPPGITINNIFPWQHALSNGIDTALFSQSFLVQPDLFLRIRPGKENIVIQKLISAGISWKRINEECIALSNSTAANTILELDKEAVVQDYNSQKAGSFIKPPSQTAPINLWDCCAASGGKSIMAFDQNPGIQLTVSDVRESILHNLHQRFKNANIMNYHSFIADLTKPQAGAKRSPFDIILADLPCTGSGTWARTPEQLYFFDPSKIEYYSNLQKKIITNVIPQLKKAGKLVYITCSVFKKENESISEFIKEEFKLELKEMHVLKGYGMKADSMFAAVFEL